MYRDSGLPVPVAQAQCTEEESIKKLAPMLLGGILIVVQNITAAPAYDLVYPMAFYAAVGSGFLIPLVLQLAKMSESQPQEML